MKPELNILLILSMVTLSFQALSRSGLNHIPPQLELNSQNRAIDVDAYNAVHSSTHNAAHSTSDSIQPELSLLVEDREDGVHFKATNNSIVPIVLLLEEKRTGGQTKEQLIQPSESIVLGTWPDANKDSIRKELNDKYKVKYFLGDPAKIKPDLEYLYRLPFEAGKKVRISQGFNGKFSHNHDISRYAIDFQLDVGDKVYAAREGKVIKVEKHFKEHGGKEYLFKANRIIIMHEDGTTASYVHLDHQGALVEPGQEVERGQLIGYSGLTGFTNGPHLHFVVRKERDLAIPIYFEGYENTILKQGKKYKLIKP